MVEKGEEEFERVSVQFGGLADLMDRFARRVAAAARIPATRFWGQSPIGMNATGDSDMRNYVMMFEAERQDVLPAALDVLDEVLARDAGLSEPLEYTWPSLLEMSDKEKADVALVKVEAAKKAIESLHDGRG